MNDKTGGNRGRWDAGALAVAAAVTVFATAFGGGSAPSAPVTAAYTQETFVQYVPFIGQLVQKVRQAQHAETRALPELRKYFQCVQSHSGPNQAALKACQHLLPPGTHASLNTTT